MTRRWLPENVTSYRDRHGKARYRFRKKGYKPHTFRSQPGTEAFREELAACLSAPVEGGAIGASRVRPGTFDELLGIYYDSPDYRTLSASSQRTYRGIYERWRETKTKSGTRYGSALVADLTHELAEKMVADLLPKKAAANTLRKRLLTLMKLAVKRKMVATNPLREVEAIKITSGGFHTLSEEEIAIYEARHPLGTMARLAFDLMLWTGQRIGDAQRMGPGSIKNKRLVVMQQKSQGRVTVRLPILEPLSASIIATPTKGDVFITTEAGKPFTEKGFSNKMRQWYDQAGLDHCSAHGLRKAAARRFAEAGCSNQQIKAWTGHTTDTEVARYTAAASQQLMSDAAAELLMANLKTRVGEPDGKSAE